MGIESATNIGALNSAWPLGTDGRNEGDNHLRLLKTVLKAQFAAADMSPWFRTGPDRFAINDKADGTGADVFQVSEGGSLTLSGGLTMSGAGLTMNNPTITTTSGPLYVDWNDDGSGPGPQLALRRNSASPAASDNIGRLLFQGKGSAGGSTYTTYAAVYPTILDPTAGSEDSQVFTQVLKAGAATYPLIAHGLGITTYGVWARDTTEMVVTSQVETAAANTASRIVLTGNTHGSEKNALIFYVGGTGSAAFAEALRIKADKGATFTGNVAVGGFVYCTQGVFQATVQASAAILASTSNTVYLRPNGYNVAAGEFQVQTNGVVIAGGVGSGGGAYRCRSGQSGGLGANAFNFNWLSPNIQAWIDNLNVGNVAITCDYRIKQDVAPLQSTWEHVKALRPVSYEYTDYEIWKADGQLRWGFVAHELQSALLPTAATGVKDSEKEIQSPDLMAVVAALTKTLQEAQTRIEALEAALAS